MDAETRTVNLSQLKARVASAQYDVDVDAVAQAFVDRMLKVQGALRRADVRELLGDATLAELRLPAA
jgi:hypothetical protein